MKTLLVTLEYLPSVGGVATYLSNLTSVLGPKRVAVLVNSFCNLVYQKIDGISVYHRTLLGPRWFWPRWIFSFWHTAKIIKLEKPTRLIISHVLPLGLVAVFFKFIYKIPFAVICHGMDLAQAEQSKRKTILVKFILKQALFVAANSNFTREIVLRFGISNNKIIVVRPCPTFKFNIPTFCRMLECCGEKPEIVSCEESLVLKNVLSDEKVVLSVGRLVKRKGFDVLLRAWSELLNSLKSKNVKFKTRLIIAGDGPLREDLLVLRDNLGLGASVYFAGQPSNQDLACLYQRASVFVLTPRALPGDVEGFGIVYLDASVFALPQVAARSGGVSEAVIDGKTGILVASNNYKETAAALEKLLLNDELRKKMGEAARERVLKEFDCAREFGKIVSFLEKMG